MRKIYFKSSSSIIKLIINEEDYNLIISDEFLYSYIPSLDIVDSNTFDASIKVEKGNTNNINFNYPEVIYQYEKFNPKDVISLIEYVFERARQEKGIICIHGAGAIYKNKLIVSWGGTTGMGKTTLALEISKKGTFYSDEKVLIDLNNLKGVGRISRQYISNDYWRKKYNTNDKYLVLNGNKKNYDIGLFIQPIICDIFDYTLDVWDKDKFFWHLYEESSRKIRGTSRMFFDRTYPAVSLDTFSLAKSRLELIKKFTSNIKGVYYKGCIDNIINKLDKLM